jgi:hypothetical protein
MVGGSLRVGTPYSSTIKTGRHDIADILLKVVISYKEKCAIIFIHPVHLSMQKRVQFLLNCSVDFDETLLLFSEICSFIRHVRLQTDIAHV